MSTLYVIFAVVYLIGSAATGWRLRAEVAATAMETDREASAALLAYILAVCVWPITLAVMLWYDHH